MTARSSARSAAWLGAGCPAEDNCPSAGAAFVGQLPSDPELAATYAHAIARGKHHYCAVIIVAHQLVRRVYGLLKARAAARAARNTAPAYRLRAPDGTQLTNADARS